MTISVNMLDARAVTVYVARAPVSNQIVAYSRKWRNETFDYQYFSCLLTCSSHQYFANQLLTGISIYPVYQYLLTSQGYTIVTPITEAA